LKRKYIKNIMLTVGMVFSATFLQACGNKVDCNNSDVKEDVITIIKEQLEKSLWYREMRMGIAEKTTLVDIKTLSHNENLKQSRCSGTYNYTYNGKPRQANVEYELAYLEDSGKVETKANVTEVQSALLRVAMTEMPIKNGVEKLYDSNGKLDRKLLWKDGKLDGEQVFYYPENGNIRGTQMVVNGIKSGSEKGWAKDGTTLLIDLKWADGKANGFLKSVNDDGKLITDLIFKDGKETGFQTVLSSYAYDEYVFKDGLLNGKHRKYSTFGQKEPKIELEENYVNGKLNGLVYTYYDGELGKKQLYKDGVEVVSALENNNTESAKSSIDSCVTRKIAAFRKENGEEATINNGVLEEWEQECTKT